MENPSEGLADVGEVATHESMPTQVLYRMKGARRKDIWHFVRLVAKTGCMGMNDDDLGSQQASGAWCLICDGPLYYYPGNTGRIREHMEVHHSKQMKDYKDHLSGADSKGQLTQPNTGQKRHLRDLESAEQELDNRPLASWIARSLRPISLVEDDGFREYVLYVGNELGKVDVKIPRRTQLRGLIVRLAAEVRTEVMSKLAKDCEGYSMTTDIWTDRSQRPYISMTVHYVDDNFFLQSWTLEVLNFPGRHTGEAIAAELDGIITQWNLPKDKCTMMLHDGASNGVSAGDLFGVPHMSCIAHTLHLVVAGALIAKKSDRKLEHNLSPVESCILDMIRDQATDSVDDLLMQTLHDAERNTLAKLRKTVQVFRNIAVYFHKSAKGLAALEKFEREVNKKEIVGTITDCPTRWSSCCDMLSRAIELQPALERFFGYLYSPQGKIDFAGLSLEQPRPADWMTIRCLVELLKPFAFATKVFSAQKHPTLAMGFPWLRAIQKELHKSKVFSQIVGSFGREPFVTEMLQLIEAARDTFVRLFKSRFDEIPEQMKWISFLDPRCSKMTHLTPEEYTHARQQFLDAIIDVASCGSPSPGTNQGALSIPSPFSTPQKTMPSMMATAFGSQPDPPTCEDTSSIEDIHSGVASRCEVELVSYLNEARPTKTNVNPFDWWRVNESRFPSISRLARNWLGCVATSVPSERAFSTGGNTVTVKRCSLSPDLVRDICFFPKIRL